MFNFDPQILEWMPVTVDDIFIPEYAEPLLRAMQGLKEVEGRLTVNLMALEALDEAWRSVN